MNCPNCNKVNSENAIFCEHCGTRLAEVSEEQQATTVKTISKKFLVSGALVGIVLCVILFLLFLPKYPKEEQLKADFIKEIVDEEENFSVSKLTIDSEMEMGEKYVMVASIIYDDGKIEYQEKYCFTYVKNDEWVIEDIVEQDEDTWKSKAIAQPSAKDWKMRSLNYFYNDYDIQEDDIKRQWFKEDDIEITVKDENANLEKQKANVTYVFHRNTLFFEVESEVKFFYTFNNSQWDIVEYSVIDYKENLKFVNSWVGIGDNSYEKVNVKFQISGLEGEKVAAVITHGDATHQMSGTMNFYKLSFDLLDVSDDEYRFSGEISEKDGKITGTIDTSYSPGWGTYFLYERYDVQLEKE